ncbi:MAG: hypothetical protein Q7R47_01650 [Candidatus Diapherotrites archaeon]|nr:hypothetical protein [Candidatus Diapherotrites archaeon]
MALRAQVSMEYLTIVMFGLLLAVAAGLLLSSVSAVATTAKAKVLTMREQAISNLLQ